MNESLIVGLGPGLVGWNTGSGEGPAPKSGGGGVGVGERGPRVLQTAVGALRGCQAVTVRHLENKNDFKDFFFRNVEQNNEVKTLILLLVPGRLPAARAEVMLPTAVKFGADCTIWRPPGGDPADRTVIVRMSVLFPGGARSTERTQLTLVPVSQTSENICVSRFA